jgi:UDPglucose 6-dehydrogenase
VKVCVIGTGYVGLVAGTCLAESGNDVICVDIDQAKIETLKQGNVPIYEPGLEELIRRNLEERRLWFTTDLVTAVRGSEICFIAVGTPESTDGAADVGAVLAVARSVGAAMNGPLVIVCKSTVPVGTADKVRAAVRESTTHEFDVVSNPEFLKEGAAVDDFMKPDRVVIGSDNARGIEMMKALYSPFVRTENPILVMDNRSAEMTKYAANAFLATRISFINEVAALCERVGADVADVRRGMGSDRRIGHHFLFPGAGYGGSCFPKDVKAIIRTARDHDLAFPLLSAVESVNERQKRLLAERAVRLFGADLSGRRFAIWGLAFKPRTDDMREAPSIVVIEELLKRGARIEAHDPEALAIARGLFDERINYHRVNYDALEGVDALIIVTDWNEFRRPDFPRMRSLMRTPVVIDGRNLYEHEAMRRHGFAYYPIGRRAIEQAS